MEDSDQKEILLFALKHANIQVDSHDGKVVNIEKGYEVEVEGEKLFKLLQDGQVVAPFNDVVELCDFIKMDMKLNEEG